MKFKRPQFILNARNNELTMYKWQQVYRDQSSIFYNFITEHIVMGNQSDSKEQQLKISVFSVDTQSQQLFDFQSSDKEEDIVANLKFPSCIAYSANSGGIIYTPLEQITEAQQLLYKIQMKNYKQIYIEEMFQRSGHDDFFIWKVLNDGQLYMLEKGDVLKIGKTKIQFKKIVQAEEIDRKSTKSMATMLDKQETERMEITNNNIEEYAKTDEEYQCRFCFESADTCENPLVSICKCSGSVKYIHYQCLKDWVSNNVKHQKSENCVSYSYYDSHCELCKHPIENQFSYDNKQYTLYKFQKVEPPYAVFQHRQHEEESNKTRISVYLISLSGRGQITVGRNNSSKVVLKDISISRTHCSFVYRHGTLFIQDKKSKFGTLVCPQKGFYFDSVAGLQLQFQAKLIRIQKQTTLNGCCCAPNNSYYVQINKLKDLGEGEKSEQILKA